MRYSILLLAVIAMSVSIPAAAQKYGGGGGSVTCESREGGYRECYSGFRSPPVLVRQLSDSNCVEGRSWGHRPGAIWVSRGCRGIFEEGRGGFSGGGRGGDDIICESRDNRYTECATAFRGPVELVEQYSSSQCVEGRSWGRIRGGIWVDRGCRGRFVQYYGGGGGRPGGGHSGGGYWQQSGNYTVECESKDNRYRNCSWDWNSGTPYLLEQYSLSPCVRGRSWGYDQRRNTLWVDEGCRALFGSR
ncbi:MAG: DUF3011 domain-containing protein [Lysobacterales bacterium]|nr:DUF3011 domain-containing protein [Rhodanobacteraceae bacterium]